MSQVNFKRAFISAPRHILPYIRQIQLILESRTDVTWFTFINEQPSMESSATAVQLTKADLQENVRHEIQATEIDAVFIVCWAKWHRIVMLEYGLLDHITEMLHGKDMYIVDIDECFYKTGSELTIYLEDAVASALAGTSSPHLEEAQQMVNRSTVPSFDGYPLREQEAFKAAMGILYDFGTLRGERDALYAMHDTHGEVIPLVYYLEMTNVAQMGLGMVLQTKSAFANFLLRMLDRRIIATDQQNALRDGFNRLIQERFHMYPPFEPKESLFLSHSTWNLPSVRGLQLRLETIGHRTYAFRLGRFEGLDFKNMDHIEHVLATLRSEMQHVRWVVCAVTDEFSRSAWTLAEEVYAAHLNKPVFYLPVDATITLDDDALEAELDPHSNDRMRVELAAVDLDMLPYFVLVRELLDEMDGMSDTDLFTEVVKRTVDDESQRRFIEALGYMTHYRDFGDDQRNRQPRIEELNRNLLGNNPVNLPWN